MHHLRFPSRLSSQQSHLSIVALINHRFHSPQPHLNSVSLASQSRTEMGELNRPTPHRDSPSTTCSILQKKTNRESKFDFVTTELKALRTSAERMEAQMENQGSGQGADNSESRQPQKHRQAPASFSKKTTVIPFL